MWALLFSLFFAGIILFGYNLWSAQRELWEGAKATAQMQVELIETHLDATLRRVDATLIDLVDRLPMDALERDAVAVRRQALESDMQSYLHVFPEVAGFRVIDARGDVLYISGGGEYVNLLDRDYVKALQRTKDDTIVFSDVVMSRITGRPTLVAARAIRAADGSFRGAVSAAIELTHFSRLFQSVRSGGKGVLVIRRRNNHVAVVREPPIPPGREIGFAVPHPMVEQISRGESEGTFDMLAEDGVRRICAFRVLAGYPFYVVAGLARDDVMAEWRGRALWVGVIGFSLFAGLGVTLVWAFRSRRRQFVAMEALCGSQKQLGEAQRLARLGSWELDLVSNELIWSEELYRIFELDPAQVVSSYKVFLNLVHPDDRDRVDRVFRDSVAQHHDYEIEHRLLMPDGRIKLILERGNTHYDDQGQPLRTIGTAQDLTDIRQLESQMQLLGSAFEHSGEAILITDRENRIITVNPAFTALTGYALDDVKGKNPRILSAGRTSDIEYHRMWNAIVDRGFWQGEIWDRRKDGGVYPKWLSISVIRDELGGVRDISSERAVEAKLEHMAHHDVLTGLLNRFSLKERLDQALTVARREGERIAVLFVDLDRFKVINDTLGHHVGDELLIEVGRRLRGCVRESDVVARLGGDEFVIMLSRVDHTSSVALVAEKLVFSVGQSCLVGGFDLYTSPSIGVAIFPTDGTDGETLMKNADAAMYHAKAAGRNNFQFFDAKMNDLALDRLKTEHALRQALARDELCLHFQPIIDVASGKVASVEALVRWQHPERGLLAPGAFIGIAEETGLIQPLGEWVLWTACRQLAKFRAAGITGLKVGINISAIQMRNGNLPVVASGVIEAYDLNPGDLIFEITESVAMEQPQETVRILDVLHGMGIIIAIDDFGTGYSSLGYLRMFPLRHLKLDRSFVEEIGKDMDGSVICDATIGLAHNLGLKVVAEGVETLEQFEYLRSRGCDLVQGYLYSPPVPADEVMTFIQQRNL
ncbi:MAG: diguanylate cyclase [Betaproteobacteria bacterium HGW-Betaproteobacteria-6]|nr:MAG: diguanylate cyclase [Betaproteobacteria bacterium HGW-Betaproteobacteria-6]